MGTHSITLHPLRVVSLFFVCLALFSCGKKVPPKPLEQIPPPQVGDLQGQIQQKSVKLSWSVRKPSGAGQEGPSYCFSVRRTELKWGEKGCPTCPPASLQELTCVDPAYPGSAHVEKDRITWADETVLPKHTYQYQIMVRDSKGQTLSLSNSVVVNVLTPPPAPVKLTVTSEAKGVRVQWKSPKKDAEGKPFKEKLQYVVERRSSKGSWEQISPIPVEGNTFLDSAVTGNEAYDYRVLSSLTFGDTSVLGESSEVRGIKAPVVSTTLPPPHTVWVIPAKGPLEIHWAEVDGQVRGYHVYRKEGKEITRLTADPVQHPPFMDNLIRKNIVYFYAVSVVSPNPPYSEGLLSDWVEMKSHFLK